ARQRSRSVRLIGRFALFVWDVLALAEACFAQSLAEYGHESHRVSQGRAAEKADHRHLWLLTPCSHRPRRSRTAEQHDERTPLHSITSSARASSVEGIWTPSALAVLRLMISSTLVACCTGRSAGFSPLRTRPA